MGISKEIAEQIAEQRLIKEQEMLVKASKEVDDFKAMFVTVDDEFIEEFLYEAENPSVFEDIENGEHCWAVTGSVRGRYYTYVGDDVKLLASILFKKALKEKTKHEEIEIGDLVQHAKEECGGRPIKGSVLSLFKGSSGQKKAVIECRGGSYIVFNIDQLEKIK
jgi:hypothetical protein